ncbi:MAG: M24 family metallopeptidase [Ardenticatenaceae bacterium]|nr:M24 family metallopeptidase [Ardenticatenaceae bacterium]
MNFDEIRHHLLPLREQADLKNRWLQDRLDTLLAELMDRVKIDMWLVIAREYNEDPVIMTLLPEPAMSARRRTILVFIRRENDQVDRYSLDRYGHGSFFAKGWNPDTQPDQYARLAELVRETKPRVIGLNFSHDFAFGDGLSMHEYQLLSAALGEAAMRRVVSADQLCVGWLERRIEAEIVQYPLLVKIAHAIIRQAYSQAVITPGVTTTDDVVWWMRQTMHDLGLRAWFQPTVEIQAPGQRYDQTNPRQLIQPGDLLHCDIGFEYLGLCTDHQQHAYVLREGETVAPGGLVEAFEAGKRVQDIHLRHMQTGLTGNEVLARVLEQAAAEGLEAQIYSHPLGYHGHAAGPTIGLWDQQGGVPGKGDYSLFDHTAYSIELNAKYAIPEWGQQQVRIALEEDAVLQDGECRWLAGRQETLHLI